MLTVQPLTVADPALYGDTANGVSGLPAISADGNVTAFQSQGNNLLAGVENPGEVYAYNRSTDTLTLVTARLAGGGPAEWGGYTPLVSKDGQFVLFVSTSKDLVSQDVNNNDLNLDQLYIHDLAHGITTLVSEAPNGTSGGNSDSGDSSSSNSTSRPPRFAISDNNRYVAFWSQATNLVSPAPAISNANLNQLYVRDLQTSTTRLVSTTSTGAPAGASSVFQNPFSSLSVGNDGSVLFVTSIDSLVSSDTNQKSDVFINDGTTRLVSLNTANSGSANNDSTSAFWTSDHSRVFFLSKATDLIGSGANGRAQLYVRDLTAGTTTLVSHAFGLPNQASNNNANGFSISLDGHFVALESDASNLEGGGHSASGGIFLIDTSNNSITLVSAAPNGGQASGISVDPVISGDGSKIVYKSNASNLISGFVDVSAASPNYFVYDRSAGTNALLTTDRTNPLHGGNGSEGLADPMQAVISNNGAAIAFQNTSSNFADNDHNLAADVFLSDAHGLRLLSPRGAGIPQPFTVTGFTSGASADGRYVLLVDPGSDLSLSSEASLYLRDTVSGELIPIPGSTSFASNARLSPDGRFVVFADRQVKLFDRTTGAVEIISQTPSGGNSTGNFVGAVDVSDDGRYVAFVGSATDLVAGFVDSVRSFDDVYLRDRQTGTTVLVNRKLGTTTTTSNGVGKHLQLSANGAKLVFDSSSTDLTPNSDTNGTGTPGFDTFAFDVATGGVSLVSADALGAAAGSREFSVSADGQSVAFASSSGGALGAHVYVRDLQQSSTRLVDFNSTNTGPGNGSSRVPMLTPDGRFVLFESSAPDLVDSFQGPTSNGDVYVRDLTTNQNYLVSTAPDGVSGGNGKSILDEFGGNDRRAISPNGRYVAFESKATNLTADFVDANGPTQPDLFVRDLVSGTTQLVSRGRTGTGGNDRTTTSGAAFPENFIALDDGRVVFTSYASNLANAVDSNSSLINNYDVFLASPFVVGGALIRGTVFDDLDSSGDRQNAEPPLIGVRVYIDADHNGTRGASEVSVVTGTDGSYAFAGLATGTYRIRRDTTSTDQIVSPATGFYDVAITSDNQQVNGIDFANHMLRPDLVASNIVIPATAQLGAPLTITWDVTNQGDGATSLSSWKDRVYLSLTPTLTDSSILLGSAIHTGSLAAGGAYHGSLTLALPALASRKYYVVVQVDALYQVADTNRANNTLTAAAGLIDINLPTLTLGTPLADAFTAPNQDRYYQITVPDGSALRLAMTDSLASEDNAIYASFNRLPATYQSDFQTSRSAGPQPTLAVAATVGGTYYILVHNQSGEPGSYHLTATLGELTLLQASPKVFGNAGQATLTVNGLGLEPGTAYVLVGPSGTIAATTTLNVNSALAYVTFNLVGVTPGAYDLKALNSGGATNTLSGAVQVTTGGGGHVVATLEMGVKVRTTRTSILYVQYTNVGNNDAPAPLITLASPDLVPMSLQPTDAPTALNLQILGLNQTGPATVLAPGATFRFGVYFRPSTVGNFEFNAFVTSATDTTELANDVWQENILTAISPSVTGAANWPAVEARLQPMIGTTWGQYVSFLDHYAALLPLNLGNPSNPDDVLRLAVKEAVAAVSTSLSGVATPSAPGVFLAGNTVTATNSTTGDIFTECILNDGSFIFPAVTPGSYTFSVGQYLIAGSPSPVLVSPGQAVTGMSLTVDPKVILTGRVTAAADDNPVAGAIVCVMAADGGLVTAVTTDASGNYAVNFAPGSYTLLVNADGFARSYSDVTFAGGIRAQNVSLAAESKAAGNVTLSDGQTVQSVDVIAVLHGSEPLPYFTGSFTSASFALGALLPGTYDISISAPDYLPVTINDVQVGSDQTVNLDPVVLDPIDPVLPNALLAMKATWLAGTFAVFSNSHAGPSAMEVFQKYFNGRGVGKVGDIHIADFDYTPSNQANLPVTISGSDLKSFENSTTQSALQKTLDKISKELEKLPPTLPQLQSVINGFRTAGCDGLPVEITWDVHELMPALDLGNWMVVTHQSGGFGPSDQDVLDMWEYGTGTSQEGAIAANLAGGVGFGGNPPLNAGPMTFDDRRLSGTVTLVIPPNGKATLTGDFTVTVNDTFDMSPAGLGPITHAGADFTGYLSVLNAAFNAADRSAATNHFADLGTPALATAYASILYGSAQLHSVIVAGGVLGLAVLEYYGLTCDVPFTAEFTPASVSAQIDFKTNNPNCPSPPAPPVKIKGFCVGAHDPNALLGPDGIGASGFLGPVGDLPYTVEFENVGDAAAQDVTVTEQLDPDLDWSTFQLGSFGWGSVNIPIPNGLTQYQTTVGYHNSDGSLLNVQVTLDFNVGTGLLTVNFVSLDPVSKEAPAGVFDGFLYPVDDTGNGQGFVQYTVQPKAGLANGTVISAQASIVFDTNDAIATNIHTNAIDAAPPRSSVGVLPPSSPPGVAAAWGGTDNGGSGIATFDVYVSNSANGGEFTLWKHNTTQTSDFYPGSPEDIGGTYRFYSVATDQVGNVEPTPAAAQRTVSIVDVRNQVLFDSTSGVLVVGGTSGKDTISVAPVGSGVTARLQVTVNNLVLSNSHLLSSIHQIRILGLEDDDAITVSNLAIPMLIEGGAGTNSLTVNGLKTANNFVLGASSLSVNGQAIAFSDVAKLAINGQAKADSLIVSALPAFPVLFNGGTGADTLQGPDSANTWAISAANTGTLDGTLSFKSVESLIGGSSSDTFNLNAHKGFNGLINGGGGTDTINYATSISAVQVNLQTKTAPGTTGFQSIEAFVGGSGKDTLIGADQPNQWNITGNNAGSVGGVAFASFENLTGGKQADVFALASGTGLSGKVDGGLGRNRLDYSASTTSVAVDLTRGAATNIARGIANFQDVTGGSAGDRLTGNSLDNVLIGGGGSDVLSGLAGRDLLFGGLGADTLLGGAGEDLLINGTTTFDGNQAAIDGLAAYWSRKDLDFATRCAQLVAGTAGVGSLPSLTTTSIPADSDVDKLSGGADRDWFFAKLTPTIDTLIEHLASGERVN